MQKHGPWGVWRQMDQCFKGGGGFSEEPSKLQGCVCTVNSRIAASSQAGTRWMDEWTVWMLRNGETSRQGFGWNERQGRSPNCLS